MNKIDIEMAYLTKDGREATVLCVNSIRDGFPVIASLLDRNGNEELVEYSEDGVARGSQSPIEV